MSLKSIPQVHYLKFFYNLLYNNSKSSAEKYLNSIINISFSDNAFFKFIICKITILRHLSHFPLQLTLTLMI